MLKGKRILITGASGEIGTAIARACASHGATVFAGYNHGKSVAEALGPEIGACALHLDVTDAGSVQAAIGLCLETGTLDGVVNCAGVHAAGPLAALTAEQIQRQLQVNLDGAIRIAQAAVIPMMRQRSGAILNIGSVAAHRVTRGHSVYSATKAGLEGFTRALAAELAKRGIRVNCLSPGPVLSKMLDATVEETGIDPAALVPMGRTIEAREVAEAAAFLLSDRASAITGAVLPVDGGYSLW